MKVTSLVVSIANSSSYWKKIQVEATKLLDDFLSDVQDKFRSLSSSTSAHDCLMSPTRIATTACQYYFLFMGRLSRSERGREALDKHHILQRLVNLKVFGVLSSCISKLHFLINFLSRYLQFCRPSLHER